MTRLDLDGGAMVGAPFGDKRRGKNDKALSDFEHDTEHRRWALADGPPKAA